MQKLIGVKGVLFEGEYKFFKKQIADFFEVTERTIELCLEKHGKELERNGYEALRGKRLTDMKLVLQGAFGTEVDFGTKTTVLGVFNFRTFLNITAISRTERYLVFSLPYNLSWLAIRAKDSTMAQSRLLRNIFFTRRIRRNDTCNFVYSA